MRRFFDIITGFLYGMAPIVVAALLGVGIYVALPNITGILIIVLIGILACWLGFSIFKEIQIIGPNEFMSLMESAPELDNLEPEPDSETKRRDAREFSELVACNEHLIKGGAIRMYGDWFGKRYANFHVLKSAKFNEHTKILTLEFDKGEVLEIYRPRNIFEAPTFLKIIDADRIKLTWHKSNPVNKAQNLYYFDYRFSNNKISVESNVDWYKPDYNVSLSAPALMIFG